MKAFIIVIAFATLIGLTQQADWSYDYETRWPGYCRTGQQQSPINIMTRDALLDKHEAHIRGPLVLRGYGAAELAAENNGHTLQWSSTQCQIEYRSAANMRSCNENAGPAPVLSGGPLRGNYTFLQFHLHWLSEHAIDGMKYPLEIHFVHIKTGLTVEQALERPDGLAVIGVLGQVRSGSESEYALEEIMPAVPELFERGENMTEAKIIDMTRLFSGQPQSFYTYHGSLTTPNCQEVVTWIVWDKPIAISDTQYKVISKVNIGGIDNYRSLQPTNRVVYRSVASCSSIISASYLGFVASLFSCYASSLTTLLGKVVCATSNVKRKIFGYNLTDCAKVSVN